MRFIICALILTSHFTSSAFAEVTLQGIFSGPISVDVWQHWQPSWNVDNLRGPHEFSVQRGWDNQKPFIEFHLLRARFPKADKVRVWGNALIRTGEYQNQIQPIAVLESDTQDHQNEQWHVFRLWTDRFVDEGGKHIVTDFEFELIADGSRAFHYRIVPMYVRGARNFLWRNQIDPYMAHGGRGEITVQNTSSAEIGIDTYDGRIVRPTLDFTDFTHLGKGAEIGLHRHESNQEMWEVVDGEVAVNHGVATRVTPDQEVPRPWDSTGTVRLTKQFVAQGGWIETRVLSRGEYMVIVPNPEEAHVVCFHGLAALADTLVITRGKRN